jgi:hypothetical protein
MAVSRTRMPASSLGSDPEFERFFEVIAKVIAQLIRDSMRLRPHASGTEGRTYQNESHPSMEYG